MTKCVTAFAIDLDKSYLMGVLGTHSHKMRVCGQFYIYWFDILWEPCIKVLHDWSLTKPTAKNQYQMYLHRLDIVHDQKNSL